MSDLETLKQYFSLVMNLVNKMRVYEDDVLDSKIMEKNLCIMPLKFDRVVISI